MLDSCNLGYWTTPSLQTRKVKMANRSWLTCSFARQRSKSGILKELGILKLSIFFLLTEATQQVQLYTNTISHEVNHAETKTQNGFRFRTVSFVYFKSMSKLIHTWCVFTSHDRTEAFCFVFFSPSFCSSSYSPLKLILKQLFVSGSVQNIGENLPRRNFFFLYSVLGNIRKQILSSTSTSASNCWLQVKIIF